METAETPRYRLTERRIAQLTLLLGAAAAVGAWALYSLRAGAGVLVGAGLAWVNFRWLAGALDGLVDASASTGAAGATGDAAKAQVPLGSIFKLAGRYILIAGAVYVTFSVFKIPIVSMLVGLCALGAATMVASLGEIVRPAG